MTNAIAILAGFMFSMRQLLPASYVAFWLLYHLTCCVLVGSKLRKKRFNNFDTHLLCPYYCCFCCCYYYYYY